MPKVERAIIMAAGLGNRMHPVTLTTPKPLVKVNGMRMIDTVVDGLHKNGINEISDQLFILDKAYIRYKSQNYVSFTYNNASFTQRINVKKTGMKAAAVLAFMVGLNSLRKVRKNRKGIKKSEKV